jgi:chromate transporter
MKKVLELFAVFFKIGAVTFGGGMSMLPILERELVTSRGWVTSEEMLDFFAVSQSLPGIIAVNVSIFIGYKRAGVFGAVMSALGVVFPSLIIITVLASGLENFSQIPTVQKALTGINTAVAALLSAAVWSFARKSFLKKGASPVNVLIGGLIFAASFAALYFFKVFSLWIIVGAALAGILWSHPGRGDKTAGGNK